MVKLLKSCLYNDLKKGNTKRAMHIIKLMGNDMNGMYRGKSLLVWAKEFNNQEVAEEIEKKGGVERLLSKEEVEELGNELLVQAMKGNLDKVVDLMDKGAITEFENIDGEKIFYKIKVI